MDGLDSIFHRKRPSQYEQFRANPIAYLAKWLYKEHLSNIQHHSASTSESSSASKVRVVCISDTHNNTHFPIPYGDILIHSGDITENGTPHEVQKAIDWLNTLPHPHKIVIGGNHDTCLADGQVKRDVIQWGGVQYLEESSLALTVPGVAKTVIVYGNPYTPKFGSWKFQYPRNEGIEYWRGRIPEGTDILVTHGPPKFHLDMDKAVGCKGLLEEVWRVKPKLHVFGHIHDEYGVRELTFDKVQRIYEKLREGGGSYYAKLREIVVMMCLVQLKKVFGTMVSRWRSLDIPERTTTLANSAVVRGWENKVGNKPHVIDLAI